MDRFAYGPKRKRGRKVLGAITGFLLAAGIAYAAWTVISDTGTNGGRIKIGTLTAPTFMAVADADVVGDLLPGGTGDLRFRINNANAVPLNLVNLGLAPGTDPTTMWAVVGTCATSNFTFTPYSNATGVTVPTGISFVAVPNTVTLAAAAPTSCQGALVEAEGLRATFST